MKTKQAELERSGSHPPHQNMAAAVEPHHHQHQHSSELDARAEDDSASGEQLVMNADVMKWVSEAIATEEGQHELFEQLEHLARADIDDGERRRREDRVADIILSANGPLQFLYAEPGLTIETRATVTMPSAEDGTRDADEVVYVEVCTSPSVRPPRCVRRIRPSALRWHIPHCLVVPHYRRRPSGDGPFVHCAAVVHPDTLYLGARNQVFRRLIEQVAMASIEDTFQGIVAFRRTRDDGVLVSSYPEGGHVPVPFIVSRGPEPDPSHHVEFRVHFSNDPRVADMARTEFALLVVVDAPHLSGHSDFSVHVREQKLTFWPKRDASQVGSTCELPVAVHESWTAVHVDAAKKRIALVFRTDARSEDGALVAEADVQQLLDLSDHACALGALCQPDVPQYEFPRFSHRQTSEAIVFILHVTHVDSSSLKQLWCACGQAFQVTFASADGRLHSFCCRLEQRCLPQVDISRSSDNVVIRLTKEVSGSTWERFWAGPGPDVIREDALLTEASVLRDIKHLLDDTDYFVRFSDPIDMAHASVGHVSSSGVSLGITLVTAEEEHMPTSCIQTDSSTKTCPVQIPHGDQEKSKNGHEALPLSQSPPVADDAPAEANESPSQHPSATDGPLPVHQRRGILKYPQGWRTVSESSDEFSWSSSCEATSPSSCEGNPLATNKPKKSVRFNDNVIKSVFRINSSILGQRKKNQKRANNRKKRASRVAIEDQDSSADSAGEGSGNEADAKPQSNKSEDAEVDNGHSDAGQRTRSTNGRHHQRNGRGGACRRGHKGADQATEGNPSSRRHPTGSGRRSHGGRGHGKASSRVRENISCKANVVPPTLDAICDQYCVGQV